MTWSTYPIHINSASGRLSSAPELKLPFRLHKPNTVRSGGSKPVRVLLTQTEATNEILVCRTILASKISKQSVALGYHYK